MTVPARHRQTERTGLHEPTRGIFDPKLLDACISCGFCLPACPTYVRTGMETSSPRGRINLMRTLETGAGRRRPAGARGVLLLLGLPRLRAGVPAGVRYGRLLERWRDHAWAPQRRPWKLRGLLWAVTARWRVRAIGLARRHGHRRRAHPRPPDARLLRARPLPPRLARRARTRS